MWGAIQTERRVLIGAALLMVSCGGESTETEVVEVDDAIVIEADTVEESLDPLMIPAASLPSCPGVEGANTFPDSYQEFCMEFVTQELLDTGNKCFHAVDQKDSGCFCKICALQGAEINCIDQQCL